MENTTRKKLMILGASNLQAKLACAAKELGYHTIIASIPGDYPAFATADETVYVDISDPEAVCRCAVERKIDGIATCCLDTGIHAVGYVAEKLGLCNLKERAASFCSNKAAMKEALVRGGVNTAAFRKVSDSESLEAAVRELQLPVVVKAVDQQGSKGVFISNTLEEALHGFCEAMACTRQDYCLVEQCIIGEEYGAEAVVYHGDILFVLPNGKLTYPGYTNVPIGHYLPLENAEQICAEIEAETRKAIIALGLNDCAVNADLIVKDGKAYIIELTGRAGATCLPEQVSIYFDIDYYKIIAMTAMGEDPRPFFKKDAPKTSSVSEMLLSEKSGRVKNIHSKIEASEAIYDFSLIIKEGSYVNRFTNSKDRIGQIIVKASDYAECMKVIEKAKQQLSVELE